MILTLCGGRGLEAGLLAEPELAGLLYRADWTKLTLSAGVTRMTGPGHGSEGWPGSLPGAWVPRPPWISPGHPAEGPGGPYRVTGRLLVAPGRRYRLETVSEDGQKLLKGCDGDRPWYQVSRPEDGSRLQIFGDPQPPEPELLRPSWLLTGFDLGARGRGGRGRPGRLSPRGHAAPVARARTAVVGRY